MNWWILGEGRGHSGVTLATRDIACAFCFEKGNFTQAFDATKKKPNDAKVLHFTTLKCGSCAGYVMVLWSAGSRCSELHDYRVLPWPERTENAPSEWPPEVGRFWVQARRSLDDENWDAAAVMARSALQLAFRQEAAEGSSLKAEIDSLVTMRVLSPIMGQWAHEVRELGNDSAHPKPGQSPTTPEDARDIVQFLDYCLNYLYTIPHQIAEYRKRSGGSATST